MTKTATMTRIKCECSRCEGKGFIRGFEHVWGGRCFRCCGSGIDDLQVTREFADSLYAESDAMYAYN